MLVRPVLIQVFEEASVAVSGELGEDVDSGCKELDDNPISLDERLMDDTVRVVGKLGDVVGSDGTGLVTGLGVELAAGRLSTGRVSLTVTVGMVGGPKTELAIVMLLG